MTWLEGRLRVGMRYVYNSQRKQNFHGMFPKQIFKPEMYVYCEAVFLIVSTLIFLAFHSVLVTIPNFLHQMGTEEKEGMLRPIRKLTERIGLYPFHLDSQNCRTRKDL